MPDLYPGSLCDAAAANFSWEADALLITKPVRSSVTLSEVSLSLIISIKQN